VLLGIDVSKLPIDPELAFVEIIASLEVMISHEESYETRQRYIDTTFAFLDAYEDFPLDLDRQAPYDHDGFIDWFRDLRSRARQMAMRIQLKNRAKSHSELKVTVVLSPDFRQEIHSQINTIRKIVVVAEISDRKRDAILAKLNALASEVDQSKTGFENALSIFLDLSEAVERGHERMSPALNRIERIIKMIAGQREDDTPALPAPDNQRRLPAPEKRPEDGNGDDLDDEIPF